MKHIPQEKVQHAMSLLATHSVAEVSEMTGISISSLNRFAVKHRVTRIKSNGFRSNRLNSISPDELQSILDMSCSMSSAVRLIGLDPRDHYIKHLQSMVVNHSLSIEKMKSNKMDVKPRGDLEVFCANSKVARCTLRSRVLSTNIIEYKCEECGNIGFSNNKPLVLQLDHINGVNDDNRLENLRFLCPNCHSQQDTSFGKNSTNSHRNRYERVIAKENNLVVSVEGRYENYCKCGTKIELNSKHCNKCASSLNGVARRKFEVSKDELENLVSKYSKVKIGKMFGVSDNAVKKRCIKLGIDFKK